jgi:hypothetical protein
VNDDNKNWPSWRYGPNEGEAQVFNSAAEVPKGWLEHPSLHKVEKLAAQPKAPAPVNTKLAQGGATTELDNHGWPFDETLHAATKTQTKDGLWRMKVGVKRPDAKPGYPLDL